MPYVAAHADRVNFFIFTTFEQFLVVPIDAEFEEVTVRFDTPLVGGPPENYGKVIVEIAD